MSREPAQFTAIHKNVITEALGNPLVAQDLIDKLDGTNRVGTLGVSSSYATIDEQGGGQFHVTKITLAALVISMDDVGASGSFGGQKIYTFPTGLIKINGARTDLTVTVGSGIGATATIKHSLGTVIAATNDTLSLTKANVIPSTNTTLASSAGTMQGTSLATAITALTDNSAGTADNTVQALADGTTYANDVAAIRNNFADVAAKINELVARLTLLNNGMSSVFNGISSAVDLYLNIGVADAGTTADTTATVSGTIYISWQFLGK